MMDFEGTEVEELGLQGYQFEPERDNLSGDSGEESESNISSSDEEIEAAMNWRDGRSKAGTTIWCKCGNCVTQKTDPECYCCTEHELLVDQVTELGTCITNKPSLDDYVTHKPMLEMMYIDGMIRRLLTGPAPTELTNR